MRPDGDKRTAGPETGSRAGRGPSTHRRHGSAWAVLLSALAAVVAGMVLPHGLLLAAGLVLAGVGVSLFDAPPAPRRGRPRTP